MASIPQTSLFLTPLSEGVLETELTKDGLTWRVLRMGDCEASHLLHIALLDYLKLSNFFLQALYESNEVHVGGGVLLKCSYEPTWKVPYVVRDVVVGIPKERNISPAAMFRTMISELR